MHDAILVGIGTAINDDPQLNGNVPQHLYFFSNFLLISFLVFFAKSGTYPTHLRNLTTSPDPSSSTLTSAFHRPASSFATIKMERADGLGLYARLRRTNNEGWHWKPQAPRSSRSHRLQKRQVATHLNRTYPSLRSSKSYET